MPLHQSSDTSKGKAAVSDVYAAMRATIIRGEIEPGTRINIDAVARNLGVSQTPVREVLQRLEGDNLVVYTSGRGYSTTPLLDLAGLRSLFEFRLLVEPWAARSAAVERLANPAAALKEDLAAFQRTMEVSDDVRQDLVAHDTRFHDVILEAAGNLVVRQALAQTHSHLHTFRLYPADIAGSTTVSEHLKVVEAIGACEPDKAEEAMAEHIRNSFMRFAQAFEGNRPALPLEGGKHPGKHIVP